MAITNYGELKAAVATWLVRTDLTQQIPDFVTLAMATLNKVLRSPRMIAHADIVIGGGTAYGTVPTDMLEPYWVQVKTDEDYPLEHVTLERLKVLRQSLLKATGTPQFYSIMGTRIAVAATPTGSTTLEMSYYQAIPAFTNDASTNWLLTYEPDIILYTALLHAAPFLSASDMASVFESFLAKQIVGAVQTNTKVTLDNGGGLTAAPAAQ